LKRDMTAINESTIASLVTTSPNLLKFDATAGIEVFSKEDGRKKNVVCARR
ncbi:hypothetical protein Bhyg_06079, partial [Pseudolycoriella hygida]